MAPELCDTRSLVTSKANAEREVARTVAYLILSKVDLHGAHLNNTRTAMALSMAGGLDMGPMHSRLLLLSPLLRTFRQRCIYHPLGQRHICLTSLPY